ncbi:class I SAM-dependent methyltransferase [Acetobacterium malicum]|uniref:class I SAM-dependent methyltransferase n=1 Tax=Acetobacterium malicum TaxID=52692 RepID=UPI0004295EB0|nr:class I SAM-dependent methyltransferase [Acetobacterium dehalogenans]
MVIYQPEKLEQIRSYWNMRAPSFSRGNVEELESREKETWIKNIVSFAPLPDYQRVLDIGCGPGFFSIMLAQSGYQVTAVDYTDNMLVEAQKNAERFGVSIDFLQMDAQNLAFEDESFDFVVSRNLTWNLEYPMKAYSEWLRVLRPQGKMLNHDGNHYYHYCDQFYQQSYNNKKAINQHGVIDGVDMTIIDNIARDLPLSKEIRPQWDSNALIELGVTDFAIKITNKETIRRSDVEREVIKGFMIFAEK